MDYILESKKLGIVKSLGDTIIVAEGLDRVFISEVVSFKAEKSDIMGLVLNIEHKIVKIALISGSEKDLRAGDLIWRTNKPAETKVGFGLIGRIVNPLGVCLNPEEIDHDLLVKNELFNVIYAPVETEAPSIIDREPVRKMMHTGINAIDALLPIGCGQRELIIGDLGSGKTSLALTIILNQRRRNDNFWRKIESHLITYRHMLFVPCIYVVIGGRRSEISRIKRILIENGAFNYTTIVFTAADELAALQYIAPFAGCAVGEWFRDNGYKALVVYDELLNHAAAYRQVSLLLRRPPGREAFPGDIFYLHARLLERAAQLGKRKGGGSLTALPLVETKAGDISAYIPTNVISITDGQIFLSSKLGNQGIKPAIDLNLSVSRVGSDAQVPCMKFVSRKIKLDYGMYRSYAGIEKMSGDIDPLILSYITRGKRIIEYFKQDLYESESLYAQVVSLFAISQGYLDNVNVRAVKYYFNLLFNLELARTYLDSKLYFFVCNPKEVEYLCLSLDFSSISSQLEELLKEYTLVFNTNYNDKVISALASI